MVYRRITSPLIIITLFLISISVIIYVFLTYEKYDTVTSAVQHETDRHAHLLQLETLSFYNNLLRYRYNPLEDNPSELRRYLDLIYMRLDLIASHDDRAPNGISFKEECIEIREIFLMIDRIIESEPSFFRARYDKIVALTEEAIERESRIAYRADMASQQCIESTVATLDKHFYEARILIVFTIVLLFALLIMILIQRKTNIRLHLSEGRFRMIYDEAYSFIAIIDRTGRITDINRTALQLTGRNAQDEIGREIWETELWNQSEEQNRSVRDAVAAAISGETVVFEVLLKGSAGHERTVDVSFKPISGAEGIIEQIIVEGRDITQRRKAEKSLLGLRNYLYDIINSMPSCIIVVTKELTISMVNNKATKEACRPSDNLDGQSVFDIYPFLKPIRETLESCILSGETCYLKKRMRPQEGHPVYNDITFFPLKEEDMEGAVIRIDDVTDVHNMEEMMIQSEKMLSVGGLAAGMAHEINNPLAGMIQSAEVIYNRLSATDIPANKKAAEAAGVELEKVREYMEARMILPMLESMRESGARAAGIVENLLSFSRKEGGAFSIHNMADLIERILVLASTDYDLRRKYDFRSIEIVREYEKDLPQISCDGLKIQQVILNIIKNGAEAMTEYRKRVTADGGMPEKSRFIIRLCKDRENHVVRIEIEDNGPGMKEDIRKRIFEPFFTTKGVGEGPGLGLSVSFFIIRENHRGTLSVESEEGKGSRFIIELPISTENIMQEVKL